VTTEPSETVLILGGGLTGLATAFHLVQSNYRITLLDHPAWQDGFQCNPPDAAPLLFGCHQETWRLIGKLGNTRSTRFDTAIPIEFSLPDGKIVAYRSAQLPGALQWVTSLFSFPGLAWHDRWTLFSHLEQIWEQARVLPPDLESRAAEEWLALIGQSLEAREHIWAPLAQWLTGNALARLSAAMFVRLLSTIFLGRALDARLTHLNGTVGDRFITPMTVALERHGVRFRRQAHLPELRLGATGIEGVQLADGTLLKAQWYVVALSHRNLLAMLPERLLTRYAYFAHLSDLGTLSATTIQFTTHTRVQRPRLLLLAGRPFHQLTIALSGPQATIYRLSASGNQTFLELSDGQLIDRGRSELRALAPEVGQDEALSAQVVRDDYAALSLRPGAAVLRPIPQSPIKNLLVAGAWTDTGWPANVESAVVSARRCAELVAGHPA
jgi:uncharacterized protein with NAD-binding domain and iron-sulfur cluster